MSAFEPERLDGEVWCDRCGGEGLVDDGVECPQCDGMGTVLL